MLEIWGRGQKILFLKMHFFVVVHKNILMYHNKEDANLCLLIGLLGTCV